ncbi:GNAT family N-acetyltransferase [Microbacterium sp. XT11]|uniref:GNAT family N-acetyltransferase n=1 Tax=Microbacterium sp. XT11 TaxID=367477 RepID=UPI0007430484|nr:GNAT family N-acetyltransferase [Microbacterium sp. XT11]ALX65706.1 hypothetical protein AB663_000373 [Microbacterium sp. XT11]
MTAPLTIREARPSDADGIAAVHVRAWRAAYRGLVAQDVLDGLLISERAEGWRDVLAQPLPTGLGTFVAERGGEIVAWVSIGAGRDDDRLLDGEVYGLYADPSAWSTGAGHALLEDAERRLADAGHARAYLWVLDGNERADAFYERHGWLADGATKLDARPRVTFAEHRRVKQLRCTLDGADSHAEAAPYD